MTTTACDLIAGGRTGKNGRDALVGMLRQSVFGRLAGHEDVTTRSGYDMTQPCADHGGNVKETAGRFTESDGALREEREVQLAPNRLS